VNENKATETQKEESSSTLDLVLSTLSIIIVLVKIITFIYLSEIMFNIFFLISLPHIAVRDSATRILIPGVIQPKKITKTCFFMQNFPG
jgi:hypothetical protein